MKLRSIPKRFFNYIKYLNLKLKYPVNRPRFVRQYIKSKYKSPRIMEIGVFEGELSYHVFSKLNPEILILIDPYKIYEGNKEHASLEILEDRFQRVKKRFKHNKNCRIIRKTLSEVVNHSEIINQKFDVIYIDGDHTFNGALLDLENSKELLSKKGVIIMDDYGAIYKNNGVLMYGINKAVAKFLYENSEFYIEKVEYNQLVIGKLNF